MKQLQRILCLDDFEAAARDFLPRQVFTYIVEAAETRSTLAENRLAFRDWWFVPRILTDVSGGSQKTTLLGREVASAFGIAPMGISALSAYRGDLVLAGAAGEADIPMIMSSSSLIPLEDLAREHRTPGSRRIFPAMSTRSRRWSGASRAPDSRTWSSPSIRRCRPTPSITCAADSHRRFGPTWTSSGKASRIRRGHSARSCARWRGTACRTSRTTTRAEARRSCRRK
jgi:L-lactate dehydrogenase (cytochrome)